MRTNLKVGIGAGLTALALSVALLWNVHPATVQASVTTQGQVQPTAQPQATGQGRHKEQRQRGVAVGVLIKATADASGLKPQDVMTQLRQGQSLADIAAAHNSSGDKVVQAATATIKARLDKAVTDGKITQDQENQRLSQFTTKATHVVNDKQLGTQLERRARLGGRLTLIETTASLTGQTRAQVQADLKSGKSIADIAAAHGSSGDKVVQAVLDKAKARLDQAVSKGRITQAQEDERLAKLHDALTAAVARPGLKGKQTQPAQE